ncbi:MAG: hypothetical protein Q8Q06_01635 [bacterium]|nr:hypothetical protein [bacterium]
MLVIAPTIKPVSETLGSTSRGFGFNQETGPQTAQFIGNTIDYFRNFDYVNALSITKIIAIVITFIFIAILGYIFYRVQGLIKMRAKQAAESLNPPASAVSAYDARWEEIKNHANSFNTAEWKLAVIEADKLVDTALKAAGFPGETMGEMLTLIKSEQLPEIGNLWEAHKLRNLLVHDPSYEMRHNDAIAAVEVFERIIREVGGLK